MRKLAVILILLLAFQMCAFADQADDLIARLSETGRSGVKSALVMADAAHRRADSNGLYPFDIRIGNGFEKEHYDLTEEEYKKIVAWYDGDYVEPNNEERLSGDLPYMENETPPAIADIIELWTANGIYIDLPAKELGSRNSDDATWDRYIVADNFEICYSARYDGSGDVTSFEMPIDYRPMRDAMALAVSYLADCEIEEAYGVFDSLEYNLLNREASMTVNECEVMLYDLRDKYGLYVKRLK